MQCQAILTVIEVYGNDAYLFDPVDCPMSADDLKAAAQRLSAALAQLRFRAPVTHVYNPLSYAGAAYEQYLQRWGDGRRRVLLLGMNPGPFGMVQTGVPFGEIHAARDWLGIDAPIHRPAVEHPKRPVEGWACRRSEVSGRRLWGLFAERFGTPQAFFAEHFVLNWCPLAFLADARNLTPDKLPADEFAPLAAACDQHLRAACAALEPEWLIGVGRFARQRAQLALAGTGTVHIGEILHPSPASPAANRGWAAAASAQMQALGIWA